MFKVYITGVFMNFFDLLTIKKLYRWQEDLRKKIKEDVKDLPECIPLEKSVFVHCNTVGE